MSPTPLDRLGLNSYWAFVAPLGVLILGAYLLPVGQLLVQSVIQPEPGLQNYAVVVDSEALRRVYATTARICLITTAIALVLGYILAFALCHAKGFAAKLLLACVLIPFWLSVLIRAFAWLLLLRNNGPVNETLEALGLIAQPLELVRNELGVIIGMVHYLIPFAVFPLYAAMRGIDPRLLQASHSLGAGAVRTFVSVYLPLSLPGVLGAAILVLVFSLGFFVTPAILGGGTVVMLAERVSVYVLQTPNWGLAAALAVLLLAVTLVMLWLLSRVIGIDRALGAR
ncbi:MAG: ABC transporter permease [Candidatus Competibacterales bacterium]